MVKSFENSLPSPLLLPCCYLYQLISDKFKHQKKNHTQKIIISQGKGQNIHTLKQTNNQTKFFMLEVQTCTIFHSDLMWSVSFGRIFIFDKKIKTMIVLGLRCFLQKGNVFHLTFHPHDVVA